MTEILTLFISAPISTVLIVGGIALMIMSVASNIGGKLQVDRTRQRWAGIMGVLLVIGGLSLMVYSPASTPSATPGALAGEVSTATQAQPTAESPTQAAAPTEPAAPPATQNVAPTEPVAPPTQPPEPTQAPAGTVYKVRVLLNGESSLAVINLSEKPFPLVMLDIRSDVGELVGDMWQLPELDGGQCALAWQKKGNQKEPKIKECKVAVSLYFTPETPWVNSIKLYFAGQQIGTCSQSACEFDINVP